MTSPRDGRKGNLLTRNPACRSIHIHAKPLARHSRKVFYTQCVAELLAAGHLSHVHAIRMIGGKHRYQIGLMPLDQVQILVDRVGGTPEAARYAIGVLAHHG
jgi:hypothetical protein